MTQSSTNKAIWMSAQGLLGRREHSRKELLQKLLKRDFPTPQIETVLDELQQRGWQDDRKFCESFIRFRVMKGQGPLKIVHELEIKGVAANIISEEIQMYDAQWLQLCENVAEKKYGSNPIDSVENKARRYRFLSTRGFSTEMIREIL